MSLKLTKKHLKRLLSEEENRVIALSGKWGTGKTHLWNEIKNESKNEKINKALYASLFGHSSIDQVKRKLIESTLPFVESNNSAFDSLKRILRIGVKAGSQHFKVLSALNDVNLTLAAPFVLREMVIVLDDIERKHQNLGIDEVLGFIDEYTNQHDTRFILILNEDELEQQKFWQTFREKVIDQEIKLVTKPEEAFKIAIELTPTEYEAALKQAIITCELTNIRIISKIIKAANRILGSHTLETSILARAC